MACRDRQPAFSPEAGVGAANFVGSVNLSRYCRDPNARNLNCRTGSPGRAGKTRPRRLFRP